MSLISTIGTKIKKQWRRELRRFRKPTAPDPVAQARAAFFAEAIDRLSPDRTVRNGVFQGLRYPGTESIGSVSVPKLIGSYEREIQPALGALVGRDIRHIVDVGCAEGYYAVGLARLFPHAMVYAFDTNEDARRLCRRMAELNGVADRVVIGSTCDPETLLRLPLASRSLVVCDCEGYEVDLFTSATIPHLAGCILVVEVHDVFDITISDRLRERFEESHVIRSFESVDDIKKARLYRYPELDGFSLAERKLLLAEHRGAWMEWFLLTPRTDPSEGG